MDYEDFIKNYPKELQLLDALDNIKRLSIKAAKTLDNQVSRTNTEKTDAGLPQKDPS